MKVDYVKFVKLVQGGISAKNVANRLGMDTGYAYMLRGKLIKKGVRLIPFNGKRGPCEKDYKSLATLAASLVK